MSAIVSSSRGGVPQLEKYELQEEIGHGGMATVYRARDLRLEREVAVKVIHKHLRENAEVRRRFVSEAKAVAKLRHPGIVDVYDVSDEADAERYLVVELIRGQSLRHWLQAQPRVPAEIGAIIVATLCDAIEHAHRSGVVHRDIKPENVLVEAPRSDDGADRDDEERVPSSSSKSSSSDAESREDLGRTPSSSSTESSRHPWESGEARRSSRRRRVLIKLTDFGIAKVLDAQGVTSTGQILGSPAHMAPEQIEGGEIGPPTDVFALGVLFYECLVGHLPFEGRNPAQVLRRVLAGEFPPADAEAPEVGQAWARIVATALHLDPQRRPPSAAAFGAAIEAELEALGILSPQDELLDYFADPDGYAPRLTERILPILLRRGERARREGRAPDAAADFNRALALRPDDLTILKRVSSLSAHAVWRQRGARFGAIALGSVALGGAAYGITKLLRPAAAAADASIARSGPNEQDDARATGGDGRRGAAGLEDPGGAGDDPPGTLRQNREPSARGVPPTTLNGGPIPAADGMGATARDDGATTPTTTARVPEVTTAPGATMAGTGAKPEPSPPETNDGTRRVRFAVHPGGATLRVDGVETPWFGNVVTLPVGPHEIWSNVIGAQCCNASRRTVTITPAPPDDPDAVQTVQVSVQIKDAAIALSEAPAGQTVTCRGKTTTGPPIAIEMQSIQSLETCTFSNGQKQSVTIKAGQTKVIRWPPS
ncbi:MAG: serine/threonine-protein kinase [Myxococcota bacterium]